MSLGRTFRLNTGAEYPAIGLGTWLAKPGEVKQAVEWALEAGYRSFDCAHVYGNQTEVGAALAKKAARVPRESIFITGKLWNTYHGSAARVAEGLDRTLRDLQTPYLDLFLIHSPVAFRPTNETNLPKNADGVIDVNTESSILETWKGMIELFRAGKVKAIGVSNFSIPMIQYIIDNSDVVPASLQIEFHPWLIDTQRPLVEFAKKHGIITTAYSPLGNNRAGQPRVIDEVAVQDIAKRSGKTAAQIIINWCVAQGVVCIPKSITRDRIFSNFQDFEMSKEDVDRISGLGREIGKRVRYSIPITYNPSWPVDLFGEPVEEKADIHVLSTFFK